MFYKSLDTLHGNNQGNIITQAHRLCKKVIKSIEFLLKNNRISFLVMLIDTKWSTLKFSHC